MAVKESHDDEVHLISYRDISMVSNKNTVV